MRGVITVWQCTTWRLLLVGICAGLLLTGCSSHASRPNHGLTTKPDEPSRSEPSQYIPQRQALRLLKEYRDLRNLPEGEPDSEQQLLNVASRLIELLSSEDGDQAARTLGESGEVDLLLLLVRHEEAISKKAVLQRISDALVVVGQEAVPQLTAYLQRLEKEELPRIQQMGALLGASHPQVQQHLRLYRQRRAVIEQTLNRIKHQGKSGSPNDRPPPGMNIEDWKAFEELLKDK